MARHHLTRKSHQRNVSVGDQPGMSDTCAFGPSRGPKSSNTTIEADPEEDSSHPSESSINREVYSDDSDIDMAEKDPPCMYPN